MITKPLVALMLVLPIAAYSQTHATDQANPHSDYAGEETRTIKSLSSDDLQEIAQGAGWGLARAAELNGVPGPTHLLELADQIGLTPEQRDLVETIRAQMQADAILAGERFVAAERSLDVAFQNGAPDADTLVALVTEAGAARASLRLVHLNAHLLTLPILSEHQVAQYAVLRGYAADPCASVPEGHDPDMWRRHNGCG